MSETPRKPEAPFLRVHRLIEQLQKIESQNAMVLVCYCQGGDVFERTALDVFVNGSKSVVYIGVSSIDVGAQHAAHLVDETPPKKAIWSHFVSRMRTLSGL